MKLLDLKDDQIVINPEVLEIPEFKALWDRDKSKGKSQAFKELKYVYYTADSNSPYSDYPDTDRNNLLSVDIFKGIPYTPDELVQIAISKYTLLSETPTQRLLKAVKQKVNDLATFLDATTVNSDTVASILKVMENTSKIVSQVPALQQTVNKERELSNSKVRAGRDVSMFEK